MLVFKAVPRVETCLQQVVELNRSIQVMICMRYLASLYAIDLQKVMTATISPHSVMTTIQPHLQLPKGLTKYNDQSDIHETNPASNRRWRERYRGCIWDDPGSDRAAPDTEPHLVTSDFFSRNDQFAGPQRLDTTTTLP
jgi:hypothetical protein